MAMNNNQILLTTLAILLLSTVISARPGVPFHPCNTLIISTFSFSLPNNPSNPNNHHQLFFSLRPLRHRFSDIPDIPDLPLPNDIPHLFRPMINRNRFEVDKTEITDLPLGFSSMRDRTKDILSVVASLLFGAACGALTAGTMYFVWSIVNYCHGGSGNYGSIDDHDDADDDIFNPKKNHYVAIPVDAASIKDKNVDAAVVAKESA